jgi:hypothetical protein
MAIETLHVREALIPGLTQRDLDGKSFYELLRDRFGIVIAGGVQTIEPWYQRGGVRGARRALHSPAFLFERVTQSETNEIVEFVHSIYRGDRYRLVTDSDGAAVPAPAGARGELVLTSEPVMCEAPAVPKWYEPISRSRGQR